MDSSIHRFPHTETFYFLLMIWPLLKDSTTAFDALHEILDELENKDTTEGEFFFSAHSGCQNDGFQNLILQLNDCLSLQLDVDTLSITDTSSEEGGDASCFLTDFSFPVWFIIIF